MAVTLDQIKTELVALQTALTQLIADVNTLQPPAPTPTPIPIPTPPAGPAESKSGTTITDTNGKIYDAALSIWTLANGDGLEVMCNGQAAGYTANVSLLLYYNGTVYQSNADGGWWNWTGGGWADASDPRPVGPSPTPIPTPTPPSGNASVGPAVAGKGFVDIDFGNKTGPTLYKSLFGSSMACDGGWNSLSDNWGNTNAQQAAYNTAGFGLPGMYVRINSENITINGDGSANNHGVDSTSQLLPKIMNVNTGTWSFGLGGPTDPNTFARGAAAVARRFINNGLPCMEYEITNELDGMDINNYCNIFNATADALHSIDSKIKVIPTNDSWMHGDRMKAVAQRCGNKVARFHYHIYAVGPDRDDNNAMSTGINRFKGDVSGCRSALGGTACANTPQGIGEYNMCGDPGAGERRMTTIYGAIWNILGLYMAFTTDPLTTHGAIWDWYGDGYYGLVIDPKSNPAGLPAFSVVPAGYALKMCRQYLGGPVVSASARGGNNLRCLVTTQGNSFGILLINFDLAASYSGQITLSRWPVETSGNGTINMQRLDRQHASPWPGTVRVSGGVTDQVTVPPMSIMVLYP